MTNHHRGARGLPRVAKFLRTTERRYYIGFNVRPWIPGRRYAWPRLYDTREEAEAAMKALPIFANKINPAFGRIISASVESIICPARPLSFGIPDNSG